MKIFREYEVVVTIKDLKNTPKGSIGTILMVYQDSNDYEVEFLDQEGNTISVLTVSSEDIEIVEE